MFSRHLKRLLGLTVLMCTLSCVRLSEEPEVFRCDDGECPSGMHCVTSTYAAICVDEGLCYTNKDCDSGEACIPDYNASAPYACEKVECAEGFGDCGAYACHVPYNQVFDESIELYTCLTSCTLLYSGDECTEGFVCDGAACVKRCYSDNDCDTNAGLACALGVCTPGGARPCQSANQCAVVEYCSSENLCVTDEDARCRFDRDCPPAALCDLTTGTCS